MLGVKLTRHATGRDLVVKFEGAYHGSYDDLEAGLYGIGELEGRTLLAEFGRLDSFRSAIERHRGEIAAIVIEPILYTFKVIPPPPGFLVELIELAHKNGILAVLDDCLMFRLAPGGSAERYGLRPDITCLGKFVGGGLPVGAIAASEELMSIFDPAHERAVYHGGSFNGNPLGCAAGRVTMEHFGAAEIERIDAHAARLGEALGEASRASGVGLDITGDGSVLGVHVLGANGRSEPRAQPALSPRRDQPRRLLRPGRRVRPGDPVHRRRRRRGDRDSRSRARGPRQGDADGRSIGMSIERLPSDLGSFSEAVAHDGPGRTIHVSGMIGFGSDGKLVKGGIAAETAATFDTIEAILGRAGAGLSDLVRMNVFMLDLAEYGEFGRVRAKRSAISYRRTPRCRSPGCCSGRGSRSTRRRSWPRADDRGGGNDAGRRRADARRLDADPRGDRARERHPADASAGIAGLDELHERSLEPEWLWPALIEDLGIELARPYERIVDLADGPERTRWFEGAELNLAGACLDRWAALDARREALGWHTELGEDRRLDFGELTRLADGAAAALASLGVAAATPSACSCRSRRRPLPRYTAAGRSARSRSQSLRLRRRRARPPAGQDSGARVLVTVDGFPRRGSVVEAKAIADRALADAPGDERVLVWRRMGLATSPGTTGGTSTGPRPSRRTRRQRREPVPADHPALLIYTSGSTGRPKGAVLTHAGMLLTIAKDAAYHVDLHRDDRLCWVTDLGWIMGAWEIVAAGSLGAYVCMIEGAPGHRRPTGSGASSASTHHRRRRQPEPDPWTRGRRRRAGSGA